MLNKKEKKADNRIWLVFVLYNPFRAQNCLFYQTLLFLYVMDCQTNQENCNSRTWVIMKWHIPQHEHKQNTNIFL